MRTKEKENGSEAETRTRSYVIAGTIAIAFALIAAMMVITPAAAATTWYVNPGESIQVAIDSASPGDTIIVRDGSYTENVNVSKRLTIRSENGSSVTTVNAANSDDPVFNVTANYVNISGFTVTGSSGWSGISLTGADHCTISRNNAPSNMAGIIAYSSNSSTITNSNVSNNKYGIYLYQSSNNTLMNNTGFNIGYICIMLRESCNNNTISNNTVANVHYHPMGLYKSSNYNTITDNNFSSSSGGYGIRCDTNNNIFTRNNVISNIYQGFDVAGTNNKIYLNNIINNNPNAWEGLTNIWNSTEPIEYVCPTDGKIHKDYLGNYWSDHPGGAEDGCGIWATPYDIPGSPTDKDYRPLMEPFENYLGEAEEPDLVITNKSEALEDGTFAVTYTVANVGDGDASESNTTIYIDGVPKKEDPVPALAAGESYTNAVDPFDCPCGAILNVTVCADNDSVVEECNETNNCLSNELECPVPVISVDIDVKPGSCPNPLNLKSKGVLPVAVLGTAEFDVTTIDPGTIQLNRSCEGCVGVAPIRWSYEDVATPFVGELCDCHDLNGDGYIDLTLKFDTQELVSSLKLDNVAGETIPLTLTGNLKAENGGTQIEGEDCIRVK